MESGSLTRDQNQAPALVVLSLSMGPPRKSPLAILRWRIIWTELYSQKDNFNIQVEDEKTKKRAGVPVIHRRPHHSLDE